MNGYQRLLTLAKAGANSLHLASYEWERVQGWAIGISLELGLPLFVWSQSKGLRRWDSQEESFKGEGEGSLDPLAVLQSIHAGNDAGIWLFEDFHPFLKDEHHPVLRWIREICRLPQQPRKLIILSTTTFSLPYDLRKEVHSIELPLPDRKEIEEVLKDVSRSLGVGVGGAVDDALLDAARGLTVMEAKLAFGQAAVERGVLDRSAVPLVNREKERIIRQSEVLEYYPAEARFSEVGGLDMLKEWLQKRGRAYGAGARDFGLDAPKGVLLLGVQGCGKSLLAKAVAAAWEFPLLRFDMGKVFGGIVGQSEGNIRAALQVAQALSPCVLWIDEIEKGLAGMGSSDHTDGGTTARVVGSLLTWMQEKKDPVFVVATANRIEMLPPELLRKGRFDEIFFVDLPAATEREEVLRIHLQKRHRRPEEFDIKAIGDAMQNFSGSEIEQVVVSALYDAFEQEKPLTTEHLLQSAFETVPLARTMREEIEAMREWARVRARRGSSAQVEHEAASTDRRIDLS